MRLNILMISMVLPLAGCTPILSSQPKHLNSQLVFNSQNLFDQTPRKINWWEDFNDVLLNELVERVLKDNLKLEQAYYRVEQARVLVERKKSELLPQANLNSSAERIKNSVESPIGKIAQQLGSDRRYNIYAINADMQLDLDVFGGLKKYTELAKTDLMITKIQAEEAQILIVSETVDTYLLLRALQQKERLLNEQLNAQKELVRLTILKHQEGLSSQIELNRVNAKLKELNAQIYPVQGEILSTLYRLNILMGLPADHKTEYAKYNEMLSIPKLLKGNETPESLRFRPDVQIAEYRIKKLNLKQQALFSEYFPKFSLQSTFGFVNMGAGLLNSQSNQQYAGIGMRWRLFDFGRLNAEIEQAKGAEREARSYLYETMLRATQETETSLVQFKSQQDEFTEQNNQLDLLLNTREKYLNAYSNGAYSLLDILEIENEIRVLKIKMVNTQLNMTQAAVAVYRSVGSGKSENYIGEYHAL